MQKSCLGSLYLRYEIGVFQYCKFKREILREKVYQLSATDHLVFTPVPFTAQIKCKNGTHHPLFLSQNNRVHIPQGCSTELKDHIIRSDFNIRFTPEPLKIIWHFNPLKLPADLLEDAGQTDQRLLALHKEMQRVNEWMEPENVNARMSHLAQAQLLRPSSYPWYWWAAIIISSLSLISFLGYCIFKKCCRRPERPYHTALPPNYAMYSAPPPPPSLEAFCAHQRPLGICCTKP